MTPRYFPRNIRPTDADRLVPLFSALSYPASTKRIRARLERLGQDPTYEAWVVEDSRWELVGFAAGHMLFPIEDDVPAAQLIALVTAEHARGRGVGAALCSAFERWATGRGAARVQLNSGERRSEAHDFYSGRGYTASGVRFSKRLADASR
ncbi:GNAT family N-acetyltransferase [Nocardiopsis alba]|uniref:GNAT family N-acetyltransferase n=1 Tax=Nocardiopsis alba TaxID=53437 RepID=UPI0033A7A8CD